MPVGRLLRRERPDDALPAQALTHLGIGSHILGVVVADELVAADAPKRRGRQEGEEHEKERPSRPAFLRGGTPARTSFRTLLPFLSHGDVPIRTLEDSAGLSPTGARPSRGIIAGSYETHRSPLRTGTHLSARPGGTDQRLRRLGRRGRAGADRRREPRDAA